MTDCEMCGNNSDKCYTVDLKIIATIREAIEKYRNS